MPAIVLHRSRQWSRRCLCVGFLVGLAVASGCGTSKGLEVQKIEVVTMPPANVALYMKISRDDGQPVMLKASDFSVYEDGKPVKKAKRALLPPQSAVDRVILVLVDISGPLMGSEYLSSLFDALRNLIDRVGEDARVAIGGFDGDGVTLYVDFDDEDPGPGLASMQKVRTKNHGVDLWGAFLTGLDRLNEEAKQSELPHQELTLVVVTDRRDKAGRHSKEDVLARVQKSPADVYTIGIGDAVATEELEAVGKSGALVAEKTRELDRPFAEVSDKIEARLGQDYVFSYCSSKREGGGRKDSNKSLKHAVEIRIQSAHWRGTTEHEFSAKGFGKGICDPNVDIPFGTKPASAHAKKKPKPAEPEEEAESES
jgi:hypothetical protein